MTLTPLTRLANALSGRGNSRRQLLRGSAAALIGGLAADKSLQREALADICGGFDTSQDVALFEGADDATREFVDAHQAPVGLLRWSGDLLTRYENPGNVNGRRWCSGTLVSDDLFLTAGFCLDNRPVGWEVPRVNGTDLPITRAEVATAMRVEFNYQLDSEGNDQVPESFNVRALAEDRLDGLDYAVLRLDDAPGARFGATHLATEDPPVGSSICIIAHPAGSPKRVDVGTVSDIQDVRIFYPDISTEGGSGGAGILSVPKGLLVGIHTNGGCTNENLGANFGLTIGGMLQVSPMLRELAGL
jgi:V8-like Glu-specific endopeptidase